MIGFENFDQLAETVVDYGHAPSLLERAKTLFIPLAGVRIGRDLKTRANEASIDIDSEVSGHPIPVPDDFGSIRAVQAFYAGEPYTLKARDETGFTKVPPSGGDPSHYLISVNQISIRPYRSGIFRLKYYSIPKLDSITTTNAVLKQFPQVYLYAALVELQVWRQDAAQRENALGAYSAEIFETNKAERRARMNAPQSVGS